MSQLMTSLKRFAQDDRGSITVEFVIWLPWLLWWFVFSMGVIVAWDNQLNVTLASQTITDVVSRQPTNRADDAFIDNILLLNKRLLPLDYQRQQSQARISYIQFFADGEVEVLRSRKDGPEITALPEQRFPTIQDALAFSDPKVSPQFIPAQGENDSIYIVETYVPYLPITSFGLLEPLWWRNVKVIRPRVLGDGGGSGGGG